MSTLAPNLFQRRFQDLVEIGRARLRPLAPEWTDHNAHDPGITLVELLAWVTEAQLYSLSRVRRDERTAYAALLHVSPAGTQAARGLIWSDRLDPNSPASTFARSVVIPSDAVIHLLDAENPTFRPAHPVLWVPGRIQKLATRLGDGRTVDHTVINARGGPAFLPFGDRAGRRDVLTMTFECRDAGGLFGVDRRNTKGGLWAIGVRAAPSLAGAGADAVESTQSPPPSIQATLIAGDERVPLTVVSDSTEGLLTTGALLLDLDNVSSSPVQFTIELHCPNGFARPPRVLRIEPNVVPVVQGRAIFRELHVAVDVPDWSFELDVPGLRFAAGEEPVEVEVVEARATNVWRRCDDLSDCAPDERVYQLDARAGRITFGNGVNGRMPSADSQVLVSYAVSDADQGSVARNRQWKVAGFAGAFGINSDPITGGAQPFGWIEQRRAARRRAREEHPLVSADDIAAAARALPLLEVARAWVLPPDDKKPRTGAVTLVAMRSRATGTEQGMPETARWLDAVRRRLVARMPLGTRLVVVAPRYVGFSIHVAVEVNPGCDPAVVQAEIGKQLRKRLALVGVAPRQPGVPVTSRDLGAWLRGTDGVRRVTEPLLVRADGKNVDEIAVTRSGLPLIDFSNSTIEVMRLRQERTP